jgi:hypothetical protein
VAPWVITILVTVMLARVGESLHPGDAASTVLLAAYLLATAGFWATSGWRIDQHDRDRRAVANVVLRVRAAVDGASPGRRVLLVNLPFPRAGPMGQDRAIGGIAGIFTIFFPSNVVDGRPVFFVEPDPTRRTAAPPGSRLAAVLVPLADRTHNEGRL